MTDFSGGGRSGERLRALDWTTTPLGAVAGWPEPLRLLVRVVLDSGHPMLIAWGPTFVLFYNDACAVLLGPEKHPRALGAPAASAFPEIWTTVQPRLREVMASHKAVTIADQLCLLNRHGYLEECYFTASCSPLPGCGDGGAGGVLVSLLETTEQVISARRLRTLRDLAGCAAPARDAESVCRSVAETLAGNGRDVPFAAIYLSDDIDERWRLSATAGIDALHPFAPLMPFDGNQPFFLSEVLLSRKPVLFRPDAQGGSPPTGAWQIPPKSLIAVPTVRPGQFLPAALLVAGINPHKEMDGSYREFFESIARQIGSHLDLTALRAQERLNDQLTERIRVTAIEQDRMASHQLSEHLLRLLGGVLDVREVFVQISELAQHVLPHDYLTMTFHGDDGFSVQHASSHAGGPAGCRFRVTAPDERWKDSSFVILDDLAMEHPWIEPVEIWNELLASGYRSMLLVRLFAAEQRWSLEFYAKQPGAFRSADGPIAGRIADHVALALSHEHLAEAARETEKARARAKQLEARVKVLSEQVDPMTGRNRIVGESAQWNIVLRLAAQVAVTEATVLLTGESGTGKEVIARFLHRASSRRTGRFVALNCATLSEQLFESELFGYERGAFTGAQQSKPGQIELAAGGVLFLDEVGEMSPSTQAKFLRVLQQREFQRLGGTRVLKADVRVIAATNLDLTKALEEGRFRRDLYYRLRVFEIRIPPLRERLADVLPLADAFLIEIARSFGRPVGGLTQDARRALLKYQWPGNVRELENVLQRAVILADGGPITAEHLSLDGHEPTVATTTATSLAAIEREMIERVLRECRGNKVRTANRLGISRNQLYVRLRRYSLD